MIDAKEAGRRLRAAREAKGLGSAEAARLLGVPQSRVSAWESGDRVMAWPKLLWYVEGLDLDWTVVLPESRRRRRR